MKDKDFGSPEWLIISPPLLTYLLPYFICHLILKKKKKKTFQMIEDQMT